MIKISEIKEVLNHNRFHAALMVYTAIMVPATDFLTGVLTALVIYFGTRPFFDKTESATTVRPTEFVHRPAAVASLNGKFEHVLVPLSLTQEDGEVVRYAKYLADIGVCQSFSFVHVATSSEPIGLGSGKLKATVKSAFGDAFGKQVRSCEVMKGQSLLDSLVELSVRQNNDLILLGHRSETAARRSLSRRLAMITQASVWMVPTGSEGSINRVLAPVDFSDASADSLRQALSITKASGAGGVSALHIFFDTTVLRSDEHEELTHRKEQAVFDKFIEGVPQNGIQITPIFREGGDPADVILREAEAAGSNLIVMSTRGRTVAATLLLGSVTSEVMAKAKVPVLAVKHFGDSMTLSQALISAQLWNKDDAHAN